LTACSSIQGTEVPERRISWLYTVLVVMEPFAVV
jgi:hypothetical protein